MKDLVVIKICTTRVEAEIAKGALEANEIQAIVDADDAGGAYPFPMSPTTRGVKLFVSNKDVKKALKILKIK